MANTPGGRLASADGRSSLYASEAVATMRLRSSLYASEAVAAMRFRANLARQIAHLPDGTKIKLKVVP